MTSKFSKQQLDELKTKIEKIVHEIFVKYRFTFV